jgi:hypothetical protein
VLAAAALLLALGCGGAAGAPCERHDDCASGLTCRAGVCLPPTADAGDAEPDVIDADDVLPDGEVLPDDAAPDADDVPDGREDGDTDEGSPPVLVALDPGETFDPADPAGPHGVEGRSGESYALILWENGLGIWDRYDVTVTVDNGRKSARIEVPRVEDPPRAIRSSCFPLRVEDPSAVPLPRLGFRILRDPLPGDTATFRVIDETGTGVDEIEAELKAMGPRAEVWADRTNGFRDPGATFYENLVERFETIILPREEYCFDGPPDVDGNGRVTILVSPTVGEAGASGYVNPLDLTSSPYGNRKDMIYLNPPSEWWGPERQVISVCGVLAHELQHLLRAGTLGIDIDESVYMNEGMSHLAADLAGYGFDNLWFLSEFLGDSSFFTVPRGFDSARMSYTGDSTTDVALRSSGYFLLRYLFDRMGGIAVDPDGTLRDTGGRPLLRRQFTDADRGIEALEGPLGASRRVFVPDWLTAMLLDGRTDAEGTPLVLPPRHRFADPTVDPITGAQRGIALNADNRFLDMGSVFLTNVALADLRDWPGSIYGGGIALLMVRPVADGPVAATVAIPRGADLGVRWVRLR